MRIVPASVPRSGKFATASGQPGERQRIGAHVGEDTEDIGPRIEPDHAAIRTLTGRVPS
jgi:hypothetical protein